MKAICTSFQFPQCSGSLSTNVDGHKTRVRPEDEGMVCVKLFFYRLCTIYHNYGNRSCRSGKVSQR